MSDCSGEQLSNSEILTSLAQQKYSFSLLSSREFSTTLTLLIASGRLTNLGIEFYTDVRELPLLMESPHVLFARSLEEARVAVGRVFMETSGYIGYITGGLEGAFLQIMLNGLVVSGALEAVIIGLEEDTYVASKGRRPLFTTEEKVSLWMRVAPDNSIIFIIPPRPESISSDFYYDWIAKYLGTFGNNRIIYIGSEDDPPEVVAAHHRRAASPNHVLSISLGDPPIHTSELLLI